MLDLGISDAQIRDAWRRWEEPDVLSDMTRDWLSMQLHERVAFFTALILPLPGMCGEQACWVSVGRVQQLRLRSRYPVVCE